MLVDTARLTTWHVLHIYFEENNGLSSRKNKSLFKSEGSKKSQQEIFIQHFKNSVIIIVTKSYFFGGSL